MTIPIKPAATLPEALNVFDSRRALQGEALKAFYVERPDRPLEELKVPLLYTDRPGKYLFTGPRGSGKSTELHKLTETRGVRSRFFIIHFSVTETLNPFDLQFVDLLLGISNRLFAAATDEKILAKSIPQIIKEDLLDELYLWYTRDLLREIPLQSPQKFKTDTSLTAKINLLALELEGKFSSEPATRDMVRERAKLRLNQLLEYINYVIGYIRREAGQETLIIAEDIDKLDLDIANRLYFQNAASLTAPRAHIIYTFPIALRYTNDFMQIRRNFDEAITLPNIKVNARDGTPNIEGRAMLTRIILERMAPDLIDPAALEMLVEYSGGVPVTLIDLTQRAIPYAIIRQSETIQTPHVQAAIDKERFDYQSVLTQEQLSLLKKRAKDKAVVNDDINRQCLHNLSLLEYRNANAWRDVHPVTLPLLSENDD